MSLGAGVGRRPAAWPSGSTSEDHREPAQRLVDPGPADHPPFTIEDVMVFEIKGRSALVTGANRGLGRAFAEALLDAGAARVGAGSLTLTCLQSGA